MVPVIEIDGLSKRYRTLLAVDSVSLHVEQGEIFGFLGLNGAGKTTTIRAVLGMIRPTAGSVRVLGRSVGPDGQGPWADVGYLVGRPAAYPDLTVRENLEIARRLHGLRDSSVVASWVDRLQLGPHLHKRVAKLSTGNLQRLALARAFLHSPRLLVLDEPAEGLDPAGVVEVRELLHQLATSQGVTVFMSSHNLAEVDRLATRFGIIHEGRLIDEVGADRLRALRMRRLMIGARNLAAAQLTLSQAGFATEIDGDLLSTSDAAAVEAPDRISALMADAGSPPTHLAVDHERLEAFFLRATGQSQ